MLAEVLEELLRKVPGHGLQNALSDACHQPADLAVARIVQPAGAGARLDDGEFGRTGPGPERAFARDGDPAMFGGRLVRQGDLAIEASADSGDLQLQLDVISVRRRLGHLAAAGNALGQDLGVVQTLPELLAACLDL